MRGPFRRMSYVSGIVPRAINSVRQNEKKKEDKRFTLVFVYEEVLPSRLVAVSMTTFEARNYRTLFSLVFINSSNAALTRECSRHEKACYNSYRERSRRM